VALVQAPVPPDRDPCLVHLGQGEVGGADGPYEHRGVDDIEGEALGRHEPPAGPGLLLAGDRQVAVVPPGEEVGLVPLALAVPQEDEAHRHGREDSRSADVDSNALKFV